MSVLFGGGTIETVPSGPREGGSYKIDGSIVKWWATKPQAVEGAKAIGWPVKSVVPVHTRFQAGYALMETFGGLVTKAGYTAASAPSGVSGLGTTQPRYRFPSRETESAARRLVVGEEWISFDLARRVTASVDLPRAETGDEASSHAHKIRTQNAETAPPTFTHYPSGTLALDRDGDVWELRTFRIGDPKLREQETPGRFAVEKYVEWILAGHLPPPIRVMESEKGTYNVNDGHHRIAALRAAGKHTVKAWVALTINRVIREDVVMPEGLTLERARAALENT